MADEFHGKPYDFFFGNHIDTHQETKLKNKKGELDSLNGFLYVIDTGDTTHDGLPIYRHPRGANEGEECGVNVDCEVGWKIRAVPGEAKFLYHSGVNGNDHPVWMVNRVDIPQPGSFTHFHWVTPSGSDPRADDETFPEECDVEMAGQLEDKAENVTCPGWFLEIKAQMDFAFEHGNEVVPVRNGDDNATHLNLVTNYRVVLKPEITPTRSSGGSH
jgi:hypothetical protein